MIRVAAVAAWIAYLSLVEKFYGNSNCGRHLAENLRRTLGVGSNVEFACRTGVVELLNVELDGWLWCSRREMVGLTQPKPEPKILWGGTMFYRPTVQYAYCMSPKMPVMVLPTWACVNSTPSGVWQSTVTIIVRNGYNNRGIYLRGWQGWVPNFMIGSQN